MDMSDPDVVAQIYVLQWLHENGLQNALKALERELGRQYDDSQLQEASQLMQLVWRHVEERLQKQEVEEEEGSNGGAEAGGASGAGPASGAAPCGRAGAAGAGAAAKMHHEEALRLLRAGAEDYAARTVVADVPAELHRSNIIAVRLVPEQQCVLTAAGDGCVRCVRYGSGGSSSSIKGDSGASEVLWEARVGSSALLSLALHPDYSHGVPLVAAGAMDGRVVVLHGPTGAIFATLQPHTKYVVRVAWSPDCGVLPTADTAAPNSGHGAAAAPEKVSAGEDADVNADARGAAQPQLEPPTLLLVTASTDETVAILRLDLDPERLGRGGGGSSNGGCETLAGDGAAATGEDGESREQGGADASGGGAGVSAGWLRHGLSQLPESEAAGLGKLTVIRQIPYGTSVTDIAFLRDSAGTGTGGSSSSRSATLVVSVRGSNYLRLLDVARVVEQAAGGVAGGTVPEQLVNMNESGDDHVSFTAKHLVVSPCGRYLLVCTDTPRLLVLRISDWSVLRVVFGLPVDQFPQPAAAWHHDSNYIYATGANAQLCVFHLGSGRLVHTSNHHKINVRDVDYDPLRNLLVTCSFDKTVKVLAPK